MASLLTGDELGLVEHTQPRAVRLPPHHLGASAGTVLRRSYPDLGAVAISDVRVPAVLALVWASGDAPAVAELVRHARKAFALGDR